MVKNLTIVVPDQLWKAAKRRSLDLGLTLKDYVNDLIQKDVRKNEQVVAHKERE